MSESSIQEINPEQERKLKEELVKKHLDELTAMKRAVLEKRKTIRLLGANPHEKSNSLKSEVPEPPAPPADSPFIDPRAKPVKPAPKNEPTKEEPVKVSPSEPVKVSPSEPVKVSPVAPVKVSPVEPAKVNPALVYAEQRASVHQNKPINVPSVVKTPTVIRANNDGKWF
jgi:hypothetical protein